MTYLVKVLDELGNFELIDRALLEIYPNLKINELIEITNEQYQEFYKKGNSKTKFRNGKFVFEGIKLTAKQQADRKVINQAMIWEKIKQRRYSNSLGGVYVASVGKWFQTGEEEKTKYLGLDKVIDKLGEIDWKCADNSFVKINRTLLDEIFMQMVVAENTDHINAERHRLAMMEAENPLAYDYSTGWAKTYADFVKEQGNG